MRCIIMFILTVTASLMVLANDITVKVMDILDEEEIPYATVFFDSGKIGCVTDVHGIKSIGLKNVSGDTLKCHAFSYEPIMIPLDKSVAGKDTLVIKLRPDASVLPELTVIPKKGKKMKTWKVGKKNNHGIFNCLYTDVDSINTLVDFTTGLEIKTKKGFSELSKFGFYIMKHEKMLSEMKFRITVYDMSEVDKAPTDRFKIVHAPFYVDYEKNMVKKDRFVYEFPTPVILPNNAMVEIEFMQPMNGEFILTKGNGIGKSVWSKCSPNFWDKDPFVRPFFLEINTYK